MSYAEGSANCTHTPGIETQENHPRSVGETKQQSSSHLLCLTNMPFFLLLFGSLQL